MRGRNLFETFNRCSQSPYGHRRGRAAGRLLANHGGLRRGVDSTAVQRTVWWSLRRRTGRRNEPRGRNNVEQSDRAGSLLHTDLRGRRRRQRGRLPGGGAESAGRRRDRCPTVGNGASPRPPRADHRCAVPPGRRGDHRGRHPRADIFLDDVTVSRKHAVFSSLPMVATASVIPVRSMERMSTARVWSKWRFAPVTRSRSASTG